MVYITKIPEKNLRFCNVFKNYRIILKPDIFYRIFFRFIRKCGCCDKHPGVVPAERSFAGLAPARRVCDNNNYQLKKYHISSNLCILLYNMGYGDWYGRTHCLWCLLFEPIFLMLIIFGYFFYKKRFWLKNSKNTKDKTFWHTSL